MLAAVGLMKGLRIKLISRSPRYQMAPLAFNQTYLYSAPSLLPRGLAACLSWHQISPRYLGALGIQLIIRHPTYLYLASVPIDLDSLHSPRLVRRLDSPRLVVADVTIAVVVVGLLVPEPWSVGKAPR